MEAGRLSLTRPSALHHAFWAAGDKAAFASQAHPSSLKAMRLLMLLDNAYLLFSTTFNTLCVGAALVWYLSLSASAFSVDDVPFLPISLSIICPVARADP